MAYSKNRRLAEIVSDTSGNLSVEGIVVPTQSSSDNDTSAASTAFVHAHIDAVLDSAPGTLNTLNEIAAALNDDANFNTTISNAIAAKLPLAGGTLTGRLDISHSNFDMLRLHQTDANGGFIKFTNTDDTDGWFTGISGTEKYIISRTADNSSPIITIEQNGKVGIGTSSPTRTFEVNSGTANASARFESTDSRALIEFKDNVGTASIGNIGTNLTFFPDNATERLRIDPNGKIFMNEGVPFSWTDSSLNVSAEIYGDSSDNLVFRNTSAKTERMRITATGNVGIGRISISQPSAGATTLAIQGTDNNKAGAIRLYSANDSVAAYIYPDSVSGLSINTSTSHPMVFRTAAAERMRIKADGKVGIGITPLVKLHVQGSSASTYTGAGPNDTLRVSGSTVGNFISSDFDGAMAYFGTDSASTAKFAAYNYATSSTMDVMIGQNTFIVKPQHFEVTGSSALTGSFNSTHSNGPYIRFQESGADKFYIGASSAISGGTYTGYDLYSPAGKTIQIFSEGRSGATASLQVKSDHVELYHEFTTGSAGSNVDVDKSEPGAIHLKTETGNGKATGITWSAGIYNTQSAITSVHNSSEGTNISVHTTDSYNNGPKERFRFDHHGHARGVSFRGTKPAQKSFVLGGGDVVKQNLVLYYNFAHSDCYGTSGTSVIDLSGNSNTGYLGGNVSYSSLVGGIMDFAGGATNNGAFIGTPLVLPTTDSVSLMFWVYYDDQPASPGDYNLMGWQASGGYCYFGVQASGPTYGYIGSSTNIAESDIVGGQQWHHLCITRDRGDGSNGRSYTYVDGILTGYRQSAAPSAHSQTMTVGALGGASNGSGSAGHTLDGKIASVAVYDRALTQPEIWHNMMVDMPRLVGT